MSEPFPDSAANVPPKDEAAPTDSSVSPTEQGKLPTAQSQDDKTFGVLSHLIGIPTSVLGPLLIWQIKKDQSKFVVDQAKEALNFQILILILQFAAGFTIFFTAGALNGAVGVLSVVFSVIGAIEASKGVAYRYPFNIRLIK